VVCLYGESEFWLASIKVIAILGLIVVGVVLFFGGGSSHDRLGFRYWRHPGAFKSYPKPGLGNAGKFLAFWTSLIRSGFAFVLGPELITIAAGESEAPRRNIPKASKRFIYRLIVFYILGTLVISVLVSSDDPALLQAVSTGSKDAGASPFVLGIKRAGINGLDHVINGVILTSAWSAANSFLYAGSRSLYSLALSRQAPKIFRTCSDNGVLYVAVLCTAAI
jgi:amino acid transporter